MVERDKEFCLTTVGGVAVGLVALKDKTMANARKQKETKAHVDDIFLQNIVIFFNIKRGGGVAFFYQMKKQKTQESIHVVSFKRIKKQNNEYISRGNLIEYSNGTFQLLSNDWSVASDIISKFDASWLIEKCEKSLMLDSAMLSTNKLNAAREMFGECVLYQILDVIVKRYYEKYPSSVARWVLFGLPPSILGRYSVVEQITDVESEIQSLHFNFCTQIHRLSAPLQNWYALILLLLKHGNIKSISISDISYSPVSACLAWKGLSEKSKCPKFLEKIYNIEKQVLILLAMANRRRKQRKTIFSCLPVDILRHILFPLICWSLPFNIPIIL